MAGETPTIVLVHGAWADATGFDAEIRALRDRGYSVIGFGNPLRDLAGDAAYLSEFLGTLTGPIVLVGHSYGGNVISTAAIGNEQVQALVYLNGWMCDVGESQQQLLEKFEGSLVGPSIRPVPFTNPDGSEGTDLYLAQEAFREAFAADVAHPAVDVDERLHLLVADRRDGDHVAAVGVADEHDRPAQGPQELGQVRGIAREIAKWVAEPDYGVPAVAQGADLGVEAGCVGPRTVDQDDRRRLSSHTRLLSC